jgi:hypothetical protein
MVEQLHRDPIVGSRHSAVEGDFDEGRFVWSRQ